MKSIIPILALSVIFAASSASAAQIGSSIGSPTTSTPTVNPGALSSTSQPSFGNPIGTPELSGALPGEPGSPTYDPNAALPSLGNAGSALAPNPGTSAASFNNPSVSSGTNPASGTGG